MLLYAIVFKYQFNYLPYSIFKGFHQFKQTPTLNNFLACFLWNVVISYDDIKEYYINSENGNPTVCVFY